MRIEKCKKYNEYREELIDIAQKFNEKDNWYFDEIEGSEFKLYHDLANIIDKINFHKYSSDIQNEILNEISYIAGRYADWRFKDSCDEIIAISKSRSKFEFESVSAYLKHKNEHK